jgi:hypothetical protein
MKHSILPDGEHVRRAIRWYSDSRLIGTEQSALELVSEAARRFDLSPIEEEWMIRTLATPAPRVIRDHS